MNIEESWEDASYASLKKKLGKYYKSPPKIREEKVQEPPPLEEYVEKRLEAFKKRKDTPKYTYEEYKKKKEEQKKLEERAKRKAERLARRKLREAQGIFEHSESSEEEGQPEPQQPIPEPEKPAVVEQETVTPSKEATEKPQDLERKKSSSNKKTRQSVLLKGMGKDAGAKLLAKMESGSPEKEKKKKKDDEPEEQPIERKSRQQRLEAAMDDDTGIDMSGFVEPDRKALKIPDVAEDKKITHIPAPKKRNFRIVDEEAVVKAIEQCQDLQNPYSWIMFELQGKDAIGIKEMGDGDYKSFIPKFKNEEIQFVIHLYGGVGKTKGTVANNWSFVAWMGSAVKPIIRAGFASQQTELEGWIGSMINLTAKFTASKITELKLETVNKPPKFNDGLESLDVWYEGVKKQARRAYIAAKREEMNKQEAG